MVLPPTSTSHLRRYAASSLSSPTSGISDHSSVIQVSYNRPLHRFAIVTAAATLGLIFAGALVTSTGSGLAVPDWPNTYGRFMFAFPWSDMVGGIIFEHSHRIIASLVGLLTVVLAVWIWRSEARAWVRWLGWGALAAVIAQGILGGVTVLFGLPTPVSVLHGTLAQIFFLIVVTLAYVTSREFADAEIIEVSDRAHTHLRRWAWGAFLLVFLQLLSGAVMRHTGSGLAFTDFPLTGGALWPSFGPAAVEQVNWEHWQLGLAEATRGQMMIHFLHRLSALAASIAIIGLAVHLWRHAGIARWLKVMGIASVALLLVQITLGAATVLTLRHYLITSGHVWNGAALLGWSYLLVLRLQRHYSLEPDTARPQALAAERVPAG